MIGLSIGGTVLSLIIYKILKHIFLWHLSVSSSVKLVLDSMITNPESWKRLEERRFYNPTTLIEFKDNGNCYNRRDGLFVLNKSYDKVHDTSTVDREFIPTNTKEDRKLYKALVKLEDRFWEIDNSRRKDLLLEAVTKVENEDIQ